MNATSADERFMARALELARLGTGLASPNPLVGAVVVSAGQIVGEGTHAFAGRKHAEVLALEQAGAAARAGTLYLNLEPCCHHGRTGPCSEAVIGAGIARVVAAMSDPNPEVSGWGFDRLRAAGIEVVCGLCETEARRLNEAFAKWIVTRSPLVTLKAAMTLDGKIAPGAGTGDAPVWITGELARAHVQELRHASDAILVGVGTVLADNPLLTDRSGRPRRRPLLRVVLDSKLRLPLDGRLAESARDDVVVFCTAPDSARRQALMRCGVRVEQVAAGTDGRTDIPAVLRRLGELEILSLLIEGGSRVNGKVLSGGQVDKVFLYFAPTILGSDAVPFVQTLDEGTELPRLHDIELHEFGDDFGVEGYLK